MESGVASLIVKGWWTSKTNPSTTGIMKIMRTMSRRAESFPLKIDMQFGDFIQTVRKIELRKLNLSTHIC